MGALEALQHASPRSLAITLRHFAAVAAALHAGARPWVGYLQMHAAMLCCAPAVMQTRYVPMQSCKLKRYHGLSNTQCICISPCYTRFVHAGKLQLTIHACLQCRKHGTRHTELLAGCNGARGSFFGPVAIFWCAVPNHLPPADTHENVLQAAACWHPCAA